MAGSGTLMRHLIQVSATCTDILGMKVAINSRGTEEIASA
jgi:hypothetical protein